MKLYHFQDNSIFYKINRDTKRKFRLFYYHKINNDSYVPLIFFGGKGTGKSLKWF